MQTATALPIQDSGQKTSAQASQPKAKRLVPLDRFLLRYSNREDPFKYEWNKGVIEKKPRTMNRNQLFIYQNLLKKFLKTQYFVHDGALICEVDMLLPKAERTRRPDIAYLSAEQMRASRNGDPSVCAFVAEVISKNDQINEIEQKLKEYFADGVQVVWIIFPQLQKVEVWRSVRDVTICFDDDVCNAAPVLEDFQVTVNELFT
ncbi:MAG: Uma2 family endonuclease [Saprospiraceae bacterium]